MELLSPFYSFSEEEDDTFIADDSDFDGSRDRIRVIIFLVVSLVVISVPFISSGQKENYLSDPKKKKKKKKKKKEKKIQIIPLQKEGIFDHRERFHRIRREFKEAAFRVRLWGSILLSILILIHVPSINFYFSKSMYLASIIFISFGFVVLLIDFLKTPQFRPGKNKNLHFENKSKASLFGLREDEMQYHLSNIGKTKKRGIGKHLLSSEESHPFLKGKKKNYSDILRPSIPGPSYHEYWANKFRTLAKKTKGKKKSDKFSNSYGNQYSSQDQRRVSSSEEDSEEEKKRKNEDGDIFDFISCGGSGQSVEETKKYSSGIKRRVSSFHEDRNRAKGKGDDDYFSMYGEEDYFEEPGIYRREIEDPYEYHVITEKIRNLKKIDTDPSSFRSTAKKSPLNGEVARPTRNPSQKRNYRKRFFSEKTEELKEMKEEDEKDYLKSLQNFGISPFMMNIWMKNMRSWVIRKVLQPIHFHVTQVNKKLEEKGLKNYSCSHDLSSKPSATHTIPRDLRSSQKLQDDIARVKTLKITLHYIIQFLYDRSQDRGLRLMIGERQRIENYLKHTFCFVSRNYLVRRLGELAKSYGSYQWDGGAPKVWNRALATDSEVVMQFLVNFFDMVVPSNDKLRGRIQFSSNHFIDKTKGNEDEMNFTRAGLYICFEKKDPPHFSVIWEGKTLKTERGKNNLWFTLCLFAYILKSKCDSYLGRSVGSRRFVGEGSQYNFLESLT